MEALMLKGTATSLWSTFHSVTCHLVPTLRFIMKECQTFYYDALQSEIWIGQTHRTEQLTTAEGSLIVRPFMFMITNTIVSSVHKETEVQVEAMNWSIDWAVFQEVKRSIMHVCLSRITYMYADGHTACSYFLGHVLSAMPTHMSLKWFH